MAKHQVGGSDAPHKLHLSAETLLPNLRFPRSSSCWSLNENVGLQLVCPLALSQGCRNLILAPRNLKNVFGISLSHAMRYKLDKVRPPLLSGACVAVRVGKVVCDAKVTDI